MKTFDLTSMGVHEMSALEMKETDGGLFVLLAVAALLLLGAASCQTQISVQIGGSDNEISHGTQKADSTLNGNDGQLSLDK
jgi:hypothetical protein